MNDEQHEIVAVSDHQRCWSKATFDYTDAPDHPGTKCVCTIDTVESRVVGTECYRNWQFPKGRNPFKVGDVIPASVIKGAQMTGSIQEVEAKRDAKRQKAQGPEKGQ